MVPSGVLELIQEGHEVLIETGAGEGSGFPDTEFSEAGAEIVDRPTLISRAELIVKVKEPIPEEYDMVQKGQILFTYFHFASSETLTQAMVDSKSVCIAYETVEDSEGSLPLLTPMSEVAGRMAIQQGAKYLEMAQGGHGVLLGGVPGVDPGNVVVIGGGIVGINAAKMACGLGANALLLAEGELDALLAWSVGRDLCDVAAAGGATRRLSAEEVTTLSRASAGIRRRNSPMPWCAASISVSAPAGQPPPGRCLSSSG